MASETEIAAVVGKFHDQVSVCNQKSVSVAQVVSSPNSVDLEAVKQLTSEVSQSFEELKTHFDAVKGLKMKGLLKECQPLFSAAESNVASQLSSLSSLIVSKFSPVAPAFPAQSVPQLDPHASLVSALQSIVDNSRFPLSEPAVFSGDPLQYAKWKSAFESFVDRPGIRPAERMHCLEKYTGGSAREAIEGFLTVYSDDSYRNAKELLDKRFGDRFVTTFAFRDKLELWPKISDRDPKALLKYSDFLKQVYSSLSTLNTVDVLNDSKENYKMLRVLPQFLVNKWAGKIADHREQHEDSYPDFKSFVDFVSRHAAIQNDPIIAKLNQKSGSQSQTVKSSSFSTKSSEVTSSSLVGTSTSSSVQPEKPKVKECLFCKSSSHYLDSCSDFQAKPFEDRRSFLFSNKLCLRCARPGHISNRCRVRVFCSVCKKGHVTSMHRSGEGSAASLSTGVDSVPVSELSADSGAASSEVSTVNSSGSTQSVTASDGKGDSGSVHSFSVLSSSGSRMCSMILPVFVSSKSNPSHEVLVYAILDSQSDSCFISEKTASDLKISGSPTTISLSTMFEANSRVSTSVVRDLSVRGFQEAVPISIPSAFSRESLPIDMSHIPTRSVVEGIPYLSHLKDHFLPLQDIDIGLLIGFNVSEALDPKDVINSQAGGPFATRTVLGWSILGCLNSSAKPLSSVISHRVLTSLGGSESSVEFLVPSRTKEIISPADCVKSLERDFVDDLSADSKSYSVLERKFLDTVSSQVYQDSESHVVMPLPFKDFSGALPDSSFVCRRRFEFIRSRLEGDQVFREHYFAFMKELFDQGYAEPIPSVEADSNRVFFIAHHGIYHKRKGKIRVVFDCSCRAKGVCLNDLLLPGPDLLNSLVGILLRFRLHDIAIGCDIEKMFYQFRVCPSDRDFLRFFWFEENDITKPVSVFRMTVHIFGAVSSPSVATFGLRYLANKHRHEFGDLVSDFICNDFYVDDGLKSVPDVSSAIQLVDGSQKLCQKGGINLTKFVSNSPEVVNSLPIADRAKSVVDLSFDSSERVLGMQWSIKSDLFRFELTLADKPVTRRGILSTVSSVFDPLGFISPFSLNGKRILQDICRSKVDWDDPLPDCFVNRFNVWKKDLSSCANISIPRCVKPPGFVAEKCDLHHFSDASETGYGQCSYLRLVDAQGSVVVSLVFAKSRVCPVNYVSIPRLELVAALLSARMSVMIGRELSLPNISHYFYTDSTTVLGYISNESKRFHTFVANRVQQIRGLTDVSRWFYVSSEENPADVASRGSMIADLSCNTLWWSGPSFLKDCNFVPSCSTFEVSDADTEVKQTVLATKVRKISLRLDAFEHIPTWTRLLRVFALCFRLFRGKSISCSFVESVSVADLNSSQTFVLKMLQSHHFAKEIDELRASSVCSGKLSSLNPFLDEQGVLRVGGRLSRSKLDFCERCPVVLPSDSFVTRLIIQMCHSRVAHQGRGLTLNSLRQQGFFIIHASKIVARFISQCVICRKLRGRFVSQLMSDLPADRVEPAPPFTFVCCDCFGPFLIKVGRKELKRYGLIFVCQSSRAIHIEVLDSLSTDSFINGLRRFISIRGQIRLLRCDNATNFVGAKNELAKSFSEIEPGIVREFLLQSGCNFEWKFNVPTASHMGGTYERLIGVVRSVLSGLLVTHGTQLSDDGLRTLMYEVAAIVNNRPLSLETLNDPDSCPITPNHLLTLKSNVIIAPPGDFVIQDAYSRKLWRRVQFLASQFWFRFRSEYLQSCQKRSKWSFPSCDLAVGDIVLLCDDTLPRDSWPLCMVTEVFPSADGRIRSVIVKLGNRYLSHTGKRKGDLVTLKRPVHKLVLISKMS